MSRGNESIGNKSIRARSSARTGGILAEPPRSSVARTGRLAQRDTQAHSGLAAGRGGYAGRGKPEWYTWLEQGWDIHVSVQLLESLARLLKLDENERAHLFLRALRQPPPVETFSPPTISPTPQQFLDQLGTIPASVLDARLNIVVWNTAFQVVFDNIFPLSEMTERDRNLIWRFFTRYAQEINEEWEAVVATNSKSRQIDLFLLGWHHAPTSDLMGRISFKFGICSQHDGVSAVFLN